MFSNSNSSVLEKQYRQIIRQAGYNQPTPLQKAVIPTLTQRKDVLIETGAQKGKTAAILASALLNTPPVCTSTKSLILTQELTQIKKFQTTVQRILTKRPTFPEVTCLGLGNNLKKELNSLRNKPAIIIGTSERIIDHIRRGNICLEEVEDTIIACGGEVNESFNQDVLYIYSKLPKKTSTAIIYEKCFHSHELFQLARRPSSITPEDWKEPNSVISAFQMDTVESKPDVLTKIFLANHVSNGIILIESSSEKAALTETLQNSGYFVNESASFLNSGQKDYNSFILLAEVKDLEQYSGFDTIIFYDARQLLKNNELFQNQLDDFARIITVFTISEADILNQLEEKTKMSINRKNTPADADIVTGKIKELKRRVKSEEDPEVLDWYKKLFKKNIPLHLRSYVAALLIKEMKGGAVSSSAAKNDFKTLFISIGKNRRVYPRDLSGMLCNTLEMSNDNIGNIKVLDNYSFVDVSPAYAQKAIDTLDGTEFRGRKITVNFARKKT